MRTIQDLIAVGLETLTRNVCQREFEEVKENPTFCCTIELSDNLQSHSAFRMSYINLAEILLGFLRASREGDWELHLCAIIGIHFTSGGFSVQFGGENPLGRIPADQETVSKDTQTAGGTKGFSLNPGAVSRYYMVAEYRSIFLSQLREILNLKSFFGHADLQSTRTKKDEADVKALVEIMENSWINPYSGEAEDLVCISTGKVAPPDVQKDLLNATKVGEQASGDFSQEKIECSSPKWNIHDKMSKQQSRTVSELGKTKTVRKESEEMFLKGDCALFGQVIVITESHKISMCDVPIRTSSMVISYSGWFTQKNQQVCIGQRTSEECCFCRKH